jgi:hypothetical protein
MKNKFSNGRLSYFFMPRIHGNVLAWGKPACSPIGQQQTRNQSIQRWEDDGGQMLDPGNTMAWLSPDTAQAQEKE